MIILYDQAEKMVERRIRELFNEDFFLISNTLDNILNSLMIKDKKWEGGTMRIHKDKY